MKHIAILLAFLVTLSSSVAAQDSNKGLAAADPGDYKTDIKEWTPLAEGGFAPAQYLLGYIYKNGDGVPQNYKEAVKWYKLAAEQGYADAQSSLGLMYIMGLGVLQDTIMAHMWTNIASANGVENGGEAREAIAKAMTPAAIEKAQAMARECMSSDYKKCGY